MANKALFSSTRGKRLPKTDVINEAGGTAFEFGPEHSLAQLAVTGCLNSTYYVSAEAQLDKILELCKRVSPEFIAKTAIYARQRGYMKDVPALLIAQLASGIGDKFAAADAAYKVHKSVAGKYNGSKTRRALDGKYEETYQAYTEIEGEAFKHRAAFEQAFNRVIRNPKMLRNFVQIMRSGITGRKSLGSLPRNLIRKWFESRTDDQIFTGSVGQNPSIGDVIKLVHPTPNTKSREALYAYLINKEHDKRSLPKLVKQFEKFKKGNDVDVPDVPFMMLSSWPLSTEIWCEIAKNAPWFTTLMNLNTFDRHGVFANQEMVHLVAEKIRNREDIKRSKVFPYQILTSFKFYNGNHEEISDALQDAVDVSVENVPEIAGRVAIFPDTSGSMWSPVTGQRGSATSKVNCVEVAGLISAVLFKRNKNSVIIPFGSAAMPQCRFNRRDSVASIAEKISEIHGGGTNISAPLAALNATGDKFDLIVYASDNESWIDSANVHRRGRMYAYSGYGATSTMVEWEKLRSKNKQAKMVCIDLCPNTHTQAIERDDILNIGGFSNTVFDLIADFYNENLSAEHWVGEINKISLDKR